MRTKLLGRTVTIHKRLKLWSALAVVVVIASPIAPASADCPDFGISGAYYPTSISQAVSGPCTTQDGRAGHGACDPDPTHKAIVCIPTEPLRESGSLYPKYMILTVVYAPPGSDGCAHNSTVSYGDGNSMGTTVSASRSTKEGVDVSVSVSADVAGNSAEAGVSFGYSSSQTNSHEMTLTKTSNSTISAVGPCKDGLNHDQDQIWLLLGPELPVETSEANGCQKCSGDGLQWSIAPGSGVPFWVYAGELKGSMDMRPQTTQAFEAYGIDDNDRSVILAADPLAFSAGDATDVPDDGSRFVRVASLPYLAPAEGGSAPNAGYEMTTASSVSSSYASSYDYNVGVSISGSAGFAGFCKAKLSESSTWAWSHSNSTAFSSSESTAASVSIGYPTASYTGPGSFAVYYDTIFKTYAFIAQ